MRRKAQIKAKWHRRDARRAAGIVLPSGRKETPVPTAPEPMSEPVPEPVAAQAAAPTPEAPAPEPAAPIA
jgi:hypothetical protein